MNGLSGRNGGQHLLAFGRGIQNAKKTQAFRCHHLEATAVGVEPFLGVIFFHRSSSRAAPTVACALPVYNVLPHARSTTARISRHVQGNAPCCISIHGVGCGCQQRQYGVSIACPKAQTATLGCFGRRCRQRCTGSHAPATQQLSHY